MKNINDVDGLKMELAKKNLEIAKKSSELAKRDETIAKLKVKMLELECKTSEGESYKSTYEYVLNNRTAFTCYCQQEFPWIPLDDTAMLECQTPDELREYFEKLKEKYDAEEKGDFNVENTGENKPCFVGE